MKKTLALLAICVMFLTGCGGTWYGTGTVIGKDIKHEVMSWPANGNPVIHKDCYYIKLLDDHGVERASCMSERVWEDAMIGHQITITEEYN